MQLIKRLLWGVFLAGWVFGLSERSSSLLIDDGFYSGADLIQLFTASFFAFCTIFLKWSPED